METVDHIATLVRDGLPPALQPRVDGTARTRIERHVSFEHRRRGRFSLWLYVVPPDHGYATGVRTSDMGAGILDGAREIVPEAVASQWFGPGNPFRWQRLPAGLELCVAVEPMRGKDTPETAAGRFALLVVDGLRQAGFFEPPRW